MRFITKLFFLSSLSLAFAVQAKGVNFDLLDATPIGSWQERQETTVNHKGKTTVSIMRSSLLGEEMREGKKHYWIEMVMESFKVSKKGKRKKDGDRVVLKTLVAESFLASDPGNVLTNMRGFGAEIIMQSGKEKPMRISGSGGMLAGMMQAMGTEVNYDFNPVGSETVAVTAGNFDTTKIEGSGSTETKVLFKKIKVDSDSTVWLSRKVPFGIVKAEGTSTFNGKPSTHTTELLAFGLSGAESQIKGEPQDMPNLGNIFGQ